MEIQVGEFIRNRFGYISKIIDIKEEYGETHYYIENGGFLEIANIKTHSFNIIDLIEEGDYVNGKEVSQVLKDKKGNITDVCYYEEAEEQMYSLGDIKSIVTKENFKEMEYEVK